MPSEDEETNVGSTSMAAVSFSVGDEAAGSSSVTIDDATGPGSIVKSRKY